MKINEELAAKILLKSMMFLPESSFSICLLYLSPKMVNI